MEIFEPIKGYEETYGISKEGNVWSKRSKKILRPNIDKNGYEYFVFSVKGERKTVKKHRLLAETFISNPEDKPTVDHINCNKRDNRICNLRWATNKEQSNNPITYKKLSERDGIEYFRRIGAIRNYGRKQVSVYKGSEYIGTFGSLFSAAKTLGVNYSKASECANGKRKHAGGYTFAFCHDVVEYHVKNGDL